MTEEIWLLPVTSTEWDSGGTIWDTKPPTGNVQRTVWDESGLITETWTEAS